jgi:pullulanase
MFKRIFLLSVISGIFSAVVFAQGTNYTLFGGFVDGRNLLTIQMNEKIDKLPAPEDFKIITNDNINIGIKRIQPSIDPNRISLLTEKEINLKKEYYVIYKNVRKRLIMNKIYNDKKYYDLEAKPGATYTAKETIFRLFAPRAEKVRLFIYTNPIRTAGEKVDEYALTEKKGGVWEAAVKGNLEGKYYTYKIISVGTDCNPELEIVDPYAKIVTRGDGISVLRKNEKQPFNQTLGRAMVVNPGKTNKVSALTGKHHKIQDAVIWEMHIRDLSMGKNSGIPETEKGLFKGAYCKGSKYKNYSTGIDHISELGVNVIQILPITDFVLGNEKDYKQKFIEYKDQGAWPEKRYYDWGYGPINYFTPEGWYASNCDDYSRINELKELISEYHKRSIEVTFDVVFNHTFEGSRAYPNVYVFRGIDADYYYRSQADGSFYDGIGCQNEFNTENPMAGKFIIDCLKYWVTEFKADGFRFDWLSAMDPETMAKMIKELRKINPDILLYGELWTLRGLSYQGRGTYVDRQHTGLFEKDHKLPPGSIAGFNDYFRDAVKGSGFMRDYAGGFIQNTINEKYYPEGANGHKPFQLVKKVINGMINFIPQDQDKTEWQNILSPLNSINYIDCHDGYTLYDKLIISEYCKYQEPGKKDSPKKIMPRSETNTKIVDFNDPDQFDNKNTEDKLKRMNKLGAAILLTSQGIPFIHAGQELLRQKINLVNDGSGKEMYIFDSNSNTSADETNAIKWENKEKYNDIFQYYRGLINLRNEHPTFKRKTKESVLKGFKLYDEWLPKDGERCIAYSLTDNKNDLKEEKWKDVIILMNPYEEAKTFSIPSGEWNIAVNDDKAGNESLGKISGGKAEVKKISMMVLYK